MATSFRPKSHDFRRARAQVGPKKKEKREVPETMIQDDVPRMVVRVYLYSEKLIFAFKTFSSLFTSMVNH